MHLCRDLLAQFFFEEVNYTQLQLRQVFIYLKYLYQIWWYLLGPGPAIDQNPAGSLTDIHISSFILALTR